MLVTELEEGPEAWLVSPSQTNFVQHHDPHSHVSGLINFCAALSALQSLYMYCSRLICHILLSVKVTSQFCGLARSDSATRAWAGLQIPLGLPMLIIHMYSPPVYSVCLHPRVTSDNRLPSAFRAPYRLSCINFRWEEGAWGGSCYIVACLLSINDCSQIFTTIIFAVLHAATKTNYMRNTKTHQV